MKLKPARILKEYQEKLYKKERVQLLIFFNFQMNGLLSCNTVSRTILDDVRFDYVIFNEYYNSTIKQIDYKNLYPKLFK